MGGLTPPFLFPVMPGSMPALAEYFGSVIAWSLKRALTLFRKESSRKQPVLDVALGNVALGACSATGQTTTKPINAFPDAANQPFWAGECEASWMRACRFQRSNPTHVRNQLKTDVPFSKEEARTRAWEEPESLLRFVVVADSDAVFTWLQPHGGFSGEERALDREPGCPDCSAALATHDLGGPGTTTE
ncbi:hypothetical protein MJT46_015487 [Ovis ammon polii x Ovis aries]|nr:hypothetical protein MJT46_015487 [Ovis ammon polii x Ovis aries]